MTLRHRERLEVPTNDRPVSDHRHHGVILLLGLAQQLRRHGKPKK
jgi:hypothetical protein